MTVGAILAIALIGAAATWLGMEIFRRIVKARRAKRIRDQWASQWSGDAGGHPHKIVAGLQDAVAYSKGDRSRGRETLVTPSAWRGTSGRR